MMIGLIIAIILTVLYTISFIYVMYDLNKIRKIQAERCIDLDDENNQEDE